MQWETYVSDGLVAEVKGTEDVEEIFVEGSVFVEEAKVGESTREISHDRAQMFHIVFLHRHQLVIVMLCQLFVQTIPNNQNSGSGSMKEKRKKKKEKVRRDRFWWLVAIQPLWSSEGFLVATVSCWAWLLYNHICVFGFYAPNPVISLFFFFSFFFFFFLREKEKKNKQFFPNEGLQ